MKTGKEIKERLLKATSEEELKAAKDALIQEGATPGSVRVIISKLRRQGKLIFQRTIPSNDNERRLTILEMSSFLMDSMLMLCNERARFLESELQLVRFEERQWKYFQEYFKRLMKQGE